MTTKFRFTYLFVAFSLLILAGCGAEGPPGPAGEDGLDGLDGQNAAVYYSEWFSPTEWSGVSGDWYFAASAPDLTEEVVEGGVILAYVWLAGDIYEGTTVRPLPAYALEANWSFLIHEYQSIEFTCDMIEKPATTGNNFRFVAIPGTSTALKSAKAAGYTAWELKNMSYGEICRIFNIEE